tara:strand:- start:59 stop:535 length:477 start_codon:yes stop_codon:yes gene_type:complete
MFVNRESYIHKYSKTLLKEFFQSNILESKKKEFNEFEFEESENNNYTVFLEYPVVIKDTFNSLKYNWSQLLSTGNDDFIPTYEELRKHNLIPLAVIDLVICSKGVPIYFFELCHTNPVSKSKIDKLKEVKINNLYEISSYWLLSQIQKPNYLKYKRLI